MGMTRAQREAAHDMLARLGQEMRDDAAKQPRLQDQLRAMAAKLRVSSMPLSDVIPLLQQAADAFDRVPGLCADHERDELHGIIQAQAAVLQEAASTFRRYAVLHHAKGTEESTAKAKVNEEMAAKCEAAGRTG